MTTPPLMFRPLCLSLLFAVALPAAEAPLPKAVEFNRDIQPVLSENCFSCHGPDKNKRKAKLRLDTKEGLFSSNEEGTPMVVPGKVDQSEVFRRITTDDASERMPDPKSTKRLSGREVALVKLWIEQGAKWEPHWAYIPPARRAAPDVAGAPAGFVRNAIDPFILEKLAGPGLTPSKEADRVTLIRRLSFDLLGLPPTKAEVDAFVNDAAPDAYERLVARLLASPHFGERMAVYWLDLVRYADSIGYHSDNNREVSPYRDWVIKAFNDNMPFDRFTAEQLAGDLMPEAGTSQRIASAYNRLLQTTEEGGAQPKEYAAKYMADRVRNVSTVWMGATMGCAECHDHKFDPITAKDFYSMAAFFADVKEAPVGKREAGMAVPSEEQATELARLEGVVEGVKNKLGAERAEVVTAREAWERQVREHKAVEWKALASTAATATEGVTLKVEKDHTIVADGKEAEKATYTVTVKGNLKGVTALRLDALPPKDRKTAGRIEGAGFVVSGVTVRTGNPATRPVGLRGPTASYERRAEGPSIANTIVEGADPKLGWAIGAQPGEHYAVFPLAEPIASEGETTLVVTLAQNAGGKQTLGKLKLSATTAGGEVAALSGGDVPKNIAPIVAIASGKRNDAQRAAIDAHFRAITPLLESERAAVAEAEKAREEYLKAVPKCLVTVAEAPRPIRVLARGNWMDDSGEVVGPAVPAFLPALEKKDGRPTRLDLARWLTAKENPLTARVFVNRVWKMHFGQGLSRRLDDLGLQGEPPSHAELLDYLAAEFVASGWDMKKLVTLVVTSGAYRQDSNPTREQREADPENRLLARQNPFRLDAEFVRDNALAVAGLLSSKVGGPSVKPYQPSGYWDYLNFPTRTWQKDKDESVYRRGLYTWWQRTFLHPSLAAFDASSREECCAERPRSNIPQQALALLNDPTYVEAARVFAERVMREGGSTAGDRLAYAVGRALSRKATGDEVRILTGLLEKQSARYAKDAAAAQAVLAVGDAPVPADLDKAQLAAWTSVCRAILNMHEAITRY